MINKLWLKGGQSFLRITKKSEAQAPLSQNRLQLTNV